MTIWPLTCAYAPGDDLLSGCRPSYVRARRRPGGSDHGQSRTASARARYQPGHGLDEPSWCPSPARAELRPVFVYRVRTRVRGPRPTGQAWPGQSPAGGRGDSWFPAPVVRPPSLRIHRRYAGTGPRRRTRRVSGRSQRPVPGVLAGDRTGKGRYVEPGPRGSQRLIHHRPRTAYLA